MKGFALRDSVYPVVMECDASAPLLPGDIIRNILKRLPVRSLIRFQCVCKYWKNLFKTQSFIQDHLHHSTRQNPSLIVHGHPILNLLKLYPLDRDMQVLGVQSSPLTEHLLGATIIDSINGLLCVKRNNALHSILLWNPSTRKIRLVARAVNNSSESFRMGFGFTSIVNDYKIVTISLVMPIDLVHRVEVYSLCTMSWKNIEFGNLLDGVAIKSDGFSTNGAIFWFGFKRVENNGHLLVSYDLATEVFTLIPSPISAPDLHDSRCRKLTVHENKLAMLSHTTIGNYESSLIDLWVMEKEGTSTCGERWNWTKKYSIKHPCMLLPGIVFRNIIVCYSNVIRSYINASERKVMDGGQNIVMVNLTTDELKRFAFLTYGVGFGAFNYVESLVPVGNNNIEEL